MIDKEKVNRILSIRYSFYEEVCSMKKDANVEIIIHVLDNLEYLCSHYPEFLDRSFQEKFRYIDYYDKKMNAQEQLDYFINNYYGNDKEFRLMEFSLFCLFINLEELFCLFELEDFFDLNELFLLLDVGFFYENLLFFSNFLNSSLDNLKSNKVDELVFLNPNNKYLIYFMGHSLDDIKRLPKDKQLQLIRKLDNPLSKLDFIPNQDAIGHVKDLYDVNIARIHFAKDYRISYVRYRNVTAILGFGFKSGKDIDYFRYDFVVRNKEEFYKEIEEFYKGSILEDSVHYKVIGILSDTLHKCKSR